MAEEKDKRTETEVEVSTVDSLVDMLDSDEKKGAVAELINQIGNQKTQDGLRDLYPSGWMKVGEMCF